MIREMLCSKLRELTLGCIRGGKGEGGGVDATPPYGFSEFFFLEDKTAAPVIFSSCSFTLRAHFETSLVMLSCNGYEI